MATTPELLRPIDPEAALLVVATREEAEHLDTDLPILLTGIGRINATAALTEVLAAGLHPATVLNVGTAGSLGSLTDVHHVGTVLLHDFSHSAVAKLTRRRRLPAHHASTASPRHRRRVRRRRGHSRPARRQADRSTWRATRWPGSRVGTGFPSS